MGKYVENKRVTLTTPYDYDDAVSEIANLVGIGKRADGMYRLADVCQSSRINPFARCKPFRWAAYNFPSAEKRAEIRGKKATNVNDNYPNNGFGSTPYVYIANYGNGYEISHGVYEYKRPRGGESEPSRLFDFDGYRHDAVSPMSIDFGKIYKDDINGVAIMFHNTGDGWDAQSCLRIDEILDQNYGQDDCFALLIAGGGYSWLLPSTVRVNEIINNSLTPIVITFGTNAAELQGNASLFNGTYLMDSEFSSIATGTEMRLAVVTSNTQAPEIDSTIGIRRPLPANGNFGSLEFKENSDRATLTLLSLTEEMLKNLACSYTSTSWGKMQSTGGNVNGNTAYAWNGVEGRMVVTTPEIWRLERATMTIDIAFAQDTTIYKMNHEVVGNTLSYDYSFYASEANKTYEATDLFSFLNNYIITCTGSKVYGDVVIKLKDYNNRVIYRSGSLILNLE